MSALLAVMIADDLTGSLDSISPFAALGLNCVTAVSPAALGPALALGPAVLSVNLGTRELSPDQARTKAVAATESIGHRYHLADADPPYWREESKRKPRLALFGARLLCGQS